MTPKQLCTVPPKLGKRINPALKGLDASTISFLRHRLASLWLAWDAAKEAAKEEKAGQGWLLFEHAAYDAERAAWAAYRNQQQRVDYAECFAARRPGGA